LPVINRVIFSLCVHVQRNNKKMKSNTKLLDVKRARKNSNKIISIEAREASRVIPTTDNHIKTAKIASVGFKAIITPKEVAIPLPPLNFSQTG